MPRKQQEAPNVIVKLGGKKDQRRAIELEYDAKFPNEKHFWKLRDGASLKALMAEGLVKLVEGKDGQPLAAGQDILCSMKRAAYDAMATSIAEASYEEHKSVRGNFAEMHVPLRQLRNPKTPRGDDE